MDIIQTTDWIIVNHFQVDFCAKQIANVINSVTNHCRPKNIFTAAVFEFEIIAELININLGVDSTLARNMIKLRSSVCLRQIHLDF